MWLLVTACEACGLWTQKLGHAWERIEAWNNDLKLPQDRLDLLELLGIMIIPKQDRKNAFKSCGDYTNVVTQIIN
jgi:hypothetical protein